MKTFAFSDLNRQSGEVLDAAMVGPVTLTKRGKAKVVMLPAGVYELIAHGRAFTVDDAPQEVADMLERAIDVELAKS